MAVDQFIKIGDLKGEARDAVKKGSDGWMDVLSWSWGATNSGNAHTGGGMGAGKVSVQDLSLVKYVDKTSTQLMLRTCTGKHYPEATLVVRKAGDKPLDYLTIIMTDVIISSWQSGGSQSEDRLTENVTLNFAKVKVKYIEQTREGGEGDKPEMTFNIAENAAE